MLNDGKTLAYSKLALTLGARARTVPIPGADKQGVFYLRTVDDIEAIRPLVAKGKKAVIVGGGYIGLETAASLRKLEVEVTVIEMMPRILQRVTAPVISEFYRRVHTEEGVSIITDAAVSEISGEEWVTGVTCKNGMSLPADFVIIGAGVLPNVELAQEADLAVENGIVVDEYATTSDPNIVAAGDCTCTATHFMIVGYGLNQCRMLLIRREWLEPLCVVIKKLIISCLGFGLTNTT